MKKVIYFLLVLLVFIGCKNKSKDTKEFEKQTKETFTALLYGSNVLSPKSTNKKKVRSTCVRSL